MFKLVMNKLCKFKVIIFIIIFLSGIILWYFRFLMLLGLFKNPHGENIWFGDFHVYYNAASLYLNGGQVYSNTGYFYPPLSLILFLPVAHLSFEQACLLMGIFNLLLLISIPLVISRILQHYGTQLSKVELFLIFLAIFLFYPVSTSFIAGQINILTLFLIIAFYYYLFVWDKKIVASLFLGIATMIKVWPVILVFLNFVTKRAEGFFARYCSIMVILSLMSLGLFGIHLHFDFLKAFLDFQSIPFVPSDEVLHPKDALDTNASPFNSIFKLLSLFEVNNLCDFQIIFGFKLIFVVFILYYFHKLHKLSRNNNNYELDILAFTFLIISVLIISNRTWIYYTSFLVLSFMLAIYVLKLNVLEKSLLATTIALLSFQQYIVTLSNMTGGIIKSAVYIASPTTYAYLIFLTPPLTRLILYKPERVFCIFTPILFLKF
ncbi:MAG TPA: DUF2029 domain-containing protein [Thermoplasmatales archaeon]|nr:DUF2029 domain-containing protein [Thermoplasmatales archaeon]